MSSPARTRLITGQTRHMQALAAEPGFPDTQASQCVCSPDRGRVRGVSRMVNKDEQFVTNVGHGKVGCRQGAFLVTLDQPAHLRWQ